MLRFYLCLSVIFILMFTLCGVALSAFGATQPINPALRGFVEGCEGIPQPCWYGIMPGVTTVQEADTTLQNRDFQRDPTLRYTTTYTSSRESCSFQVDVAFNDVNVDYLHIFLCSGLQVGDVLAALDGKPDTIWGNCLGEVMLTQGSVSVYSTDISIYSSTRVIVIYPQNYNNVLGVPWHGFGIYDYLGDPGCG
jgi:hypothetical protein